MHKIYRDKSTYKKYIIYTYVYPTKMVNKVVHCDISLPTGWYKVIDQWVILFVYLEKYASTKRRG